MLRSDAVTSGINAAANPDLVGLTPLQCMDRIVAYCESVNIRVILDRHSSKADNYQNEQLWYIPGDPYYTEQRYIFMKLYYYLIWYTEYHLLNRFIDDWVMLADRYSNSAVIGADLWNDPKGISTWGSGNIGTDWNLAAERVGAAIQADNEKWLLIVEGIGNATWWGSNLEGVATNPVRLPKQNQLVYSVHEYANDTFTQVIIIISQLII